MANDKYVLAGWEYGNFWKLAEFYDYDIVDYGLTTVDDPHQGTSYTYEEAELKRQYLQKEYPDYGWYLLRLNENSK